MIQIDIPMPTNCKECDERDIRQLLWCRLIYSGCANCGRHPNCPLKEVNECETEDCISRKAAIDGLGEQPYVWTDSDYEIQRSDDWKSTKAMLESLPSVYPKKVECNDCYWNKDAIPSVYPKSDAEDIPTITIPVEDYLLLMEYEKANEQLKKQIEMLKLDRECDKPKTGHWIEHPTEEDYSVCSHCGIGSRRMEHGENADGTKYIDIYSYRFCPYCGAKMIEEQQGEQECM